MSRFLLLPRPPPLLALLVLRPTRSVISDMEFLISLKSRFSAAVFISDDDVDEEDVDEDDEDVI